MKILLEGFPIDEVPTRIRRPGELFTRLVGVNIYDEGRTVEPVYMPLARVSIRAGQAFIEINGSRPLLYITLQRRRPFVSVFRFPWEEEDPEKEPIGNG